MTAVSLVFDSNHGKGGDTVVTGQVTELLVSVYPQHFPALVRNRDPQFHFLPLLLVGEETEALGRQLPS